MTKKPNKAEQPWPADKIERRKVDDLVPYARNSRTHSPDQIDQIAASINEWGFTNPVLVDETGTIIAGHGRVMAAKKLGLVEIPCMTATGWSEAQRRAYVIADNKLALNAEWDVSALKIEMDDLSGLNFDLELTGFDLDELGDMFDTGEGLEDGFDDVQPPEDDPSTSLIVIGPYRVPATIGAIERLITELREEGGDEKLQVHETILHRLGVMT